jgi:hypothetical protein
VTVSLEQEASLTRSGESIKATTWRRAGIGVARPAQASVSIRDQLRDYLQAFASAWKTANAGR